MHQMNLRINNLPLHLILVSDGTVAIIPNNLQTIIYDQPEEGIHATIMPEKMLVGGKEIPYNTALRLENNPELKQWLIEQNMQAPW